MLKSHHGNNFNLLRFIFAGLVILSHAPEIRDGDRHEELLTQLFGTLSFGELAVDCFFILSGFLILKSWHEHPDIFGFSASRVLRIYPGFVAASLICAFIIGPLFGASSYFEDFQWKTYFSALIRLGFRGVPPAFQGSHAQTVNAAIWTIPYEFKCYVLVLALGATGLIRHSAIWPTILLVCTAAYLANILNVVHVPFDFHVRFLMAFSAGACFYIYRSSIPWSHAAAVLAAALCGLALFFKPLAEPAVCTLGAYAILRYAMAGQALLAFNRLPDISYGVYLYAWPINKVVLWYVPAIDVHALILTVFLLSVVAGTISWYAVERPFMRMKPRLRLESARASAIHFLGRAR
jgi:peptidoglycan/LPS O-acetylase OafA/YrhL